MQYKTTIATSIREKRTEIPFLRLCGVGVRPGDEEGGLASSATEQNWRSGHPKRAVHRSAHRRKRLVPELIPYSTLKIYPSGKCIKKKEEIPQQFNSIKMRECNKRARNVYYEAILIR